MTTPTDKPVYCFTISASDITDPPSVYCDPELVTVGTRNALIEFDLITPGYSFDPDTPITFAEPAADFPDLWVISATQVTLRDRCLVAGDYAFTLHVVEDATGTRFKVDPTIRNSGH